MSVKGCGDRKDITSIKKLGERSLGGRPFLAQCKREKEKKVKFYSKKKTKHQGINDSFWPGR